MRVLHSNVIVRPAIVAKAPARSRTGHAPTAWPARPRPRARGVRVGRYAVDYDAQIRVARVRSVFERLAVTLGVTVVGAMVLTVVLDATGASPAVWAWLALVLALSAARLAAGHVMANSPARLSWAGWERLAVGGALISGLLWGVGAVVLTPGTAPPGALVAHLLWVILLGAMCAGVATVHAMHLPSTLAFLLPAGLPLMLNEVAKGEPAPLARALLVLVFLAVLVATARRSSRSFGEVFRLQIALEERTRALDHANAELRAEVEKHRATNESLRQAQRMEAIGRLTGGIAHDFNNVLAVIGGNLQLIERRAEGQAEILRLADAAQRAAERGARLTASLLSFGRMQKMSPAPVDLHLLLRESVSLLRRTLEGRMELALDLAPGPAVAMADPAHFQAALLHLVINARDASPAGEELAISTARVELAEADLAGNPDARPGRFVAVTVRDDGAGMSPEVVDRAFDPFFTTKEVGQGSGLGLSQVYGFARQLGGHTRIDSRAGGGTAVTIYLPLVAAAEAPAPRPCAMPADGRRHVLLVEDDADVRPVLTENLLAAGWQVTAVADGSAALEELRRGGKLDMLVTDVVMPGAVSGVELARRATSMRPGLPVLLISGYAAATLAAHGASEDEFDLLRKPFTADELLARMQRASSVTEEKKAVLF
jgi:signal transduction histidine kinase/CheY-like chemotaxis protein